MQFIVSPRTFCSDKLVLVIAYLSFQLCQIGFRKASFGKQFLSSFVGGFAELDNTAINTYTLYLTAGNNSEGQAIYEEGRSIIVSKPVAITSDLGDNPPSPEMLKFGNETKSYFTESAPKVVGDANGDKTTDIRDLVRLKTVLAGLSEETENADVDNNGVIDSFDLAALRKILLGILG